MPMMPEHEDVLTIAPPSPCFEDLRDFVLHAQKYAA
jgi:hypothetical protein